MYLGSWKCLWTGYLANTQRKDILHVLHSSKLWAQSCIRKICQTLYQFFGDQRDPFFRKTHKNFVWTFLYKLSILVIRNHGKSSLFFVGRKVTSSWYYRLQQFVSGFYPYNFPNLCVLLSTEADRSL